VVCRRDQLKPAIQSCCKRAAEGIAGACGVHNLCFWCRYSMGLSIEKYLGAVCAQGEDDCRHTGFQRKLFRARTVRSQHNHRFLLIWRKNVHTFPAIDTCKGFDRAWVEDYCGSFSRQACCCQRYLSRYFTLQQEYRGGLKGWQCLA
jgi:hypothetical protein